MMLVAGEFGDGTEHYALDTEVVGQDTSLWFWGYLWGDFWNGDFNQCESFGTTTVYGENLDITVTNGIGLPTGKLCDGNSIHGVSKFAKCTDYI